MVPVGLSLADAGQFASARIAPVLGLTAIAVAPCGEYSAPTSARTRSTSCWSPESIVSATVLPGTVGAQVVDRDRLADRVADDPA